MDNLLIPQKIKVGFNHREDTYSKKLAYVTYINNKNQIAKEKSWTRWKDDNMPVEDYENEPISGFVLNKKVGGYQYSWNHRQTYSRVYDPRGFEFEITVENLLFILAYCDCLKGKGLEGEFVYGWFGKELVLLPVACQEYQNSLEYTRLSKTKVISPTKLKEYYTYKTDRGDEYIYLGKQEIKYHEYETIELVKPNYDIQNENKRAYPYYYRVISIKTDKKTVPFFYNVKNKEFTYGKLPLKEIVSETTPDNIAFLIEEVIKKASVHSKLEDNFIKIDYFYNGYYFYKRDGKWYHGLVDYSSSVTYAPNYKYEYEYRFTQEREMFFDNENQTITFGGVVENLKRYNQEEMSKIEGYYLSNPLDYLNK